MAPKASKNIPHEIRPLGKRKRVLAASLASTDNVDPLAIKRRKHEVNAAAASATAASATAAAAAAQHGPTVDEMRDPSPDPFELDLQRFEAANGDDNHQSDSDIEMYMPEKAANVEEQDEDVQIEETDEEKLSESYIILES